MTTAFQKEQIPKALGWRMPAEWELHEATWLAWPTDVETWPNEMPQVEAIYVQIVRELHQGEEVHILVEDEVHEERVAKQLKSDGVEEHVFFHSVKTASNWIRDYGPLFLVGTGGEIAICHWRFNAWGRKYKSDEQDAHVAQALTQEMGWVRFQPEMVLEGGAIEVNGSGLLMATEQCLFHPNRNPHLGRRGIERYLQNFLGVERFIWLCGGISGDDTDGHVDTVARFVGPKMIVACLEDDESDGNFRALKRNWHRLERARSEGREAFDLIALPMPGRVQHGASRLPASYANFYIGNCTVLVPTYGHPNDDRALKILADLFPKRRVVGIHSIPLIYGRGAIHCATQPQPR